MAAMLHLLHHALVPVSPPAKSILITPSWPPPGADPRYHWIEGESAGPLGRLPDRLFEHLFRRQLVVELGRDVDEPGFAGVIRLVELLAVERGVGDGASGVSAASLRVLEALFPDWPPLGARHMVPEQLRRGVEARAGRKGLLYWFEVLFARPFPVFAGRLNSWVTWWAAQWLMGPCTLDDLSPEDLAAAPSELYGGQGAQVLVHRCRFLEEAGCASVCVNACKMPTQAFFNEEMGVPMRMLPDYETRLRTRKRRAPWHASPRAPPRARCAARPRAAPWSAQPGPDFRGTPRRPLFRVRSDPLPRGRLVRPCVRPIRNRMKLTSFVGMLVPRAVSYLTRR
jgi:hypothetical protein